MKPIIPLILVAAYSSVAIHAYRISGKVTDGYTNVGLPYSTIKAISKTDSVLNVAQSGAEGEFCIPCILQGGGHKAGALLVGGA